MRAKRERQTDRQRHRYRQADRQTDRQMRPTGTVERKLCTAVTH